MGTGGAGSANDQVVEVVRDFGQIELLEQIIVVVQLHVHNARIGAAFGALKGRCGTGAAKFRGRIHFAVIPVNAAVEDAGQ